MHFFLLLQADKASKIKWTKNETSTIRVLSLSFHDQSLHTSNIDLNWFLLINSGVLECQENWHNNVENVVWCLVNLQYFISNISHQHVGGLFKNTEAYICVYIYPPFLSSNENWFYIYIYIHKCINFIYFSTSKSFPHLFSMCLC